MSHTKHSVLFQTALTGLKKTMAEQMNKNQFVIYIIISNCGNFS